MTFIKKIETKLLKYLQKKNLGDVRWTNLFSQPTRINYDVFVGWTFACINERAKGFAKKNIYFEKQIDFETSEPFPKDYWLNYLMSQPNEYVSWYQLKNLASKWLDLNGNAYFWTPIGKTVPHSIWVLPSDRVTLTYGENGGINNYTLNTPGGLKIIPRNEVCHVKTLSPTNLMENNFYLGVPELINAAMDVILTEAEKQRFIQDYLKRDMTDPYVITTIERMDADEWSKWLAAYNEVMPNAYKAKALLDEGKKAEMLNKNTTTFNIDLQEIKQQLTSIFGVPIGLLTGELANRATAQVLAERFESNTIEPNAILFTEELTRHFKQFDNDLVWTFEEFTSKDPYFELELKRFRLDYGISTPEQIAREDGYIIENEEIIENQFKKKRLSETRTQYWINNAKAMKYHEVVIANILRKEFKELMNEVLLNIENEKDYKFVNLFSNFNIDIWEKRIVDKSSPKYRNLAKDIIKQAINIIGGVVTDFEDAIKSAVNVSTSKIRESLNTIQSNLKDEVIKVTNANPTANRAQLIELINERIKDKFNRDILQSRVKMIATTTTTAATGTAQKEAYKKRGYIDVWLSQRDSKVRSNHLSTDGQRPDDEGYFTVGADRMKSPGTGEIAAENINCRCSLFPEKI